MRLLLVRHGESEGDTRPIHKGWIDPPLSPRGRRQADLLALRLDREPLDALYSSDLMRALQTAEAVAGRRGMPVVPLPQFREMRFGEWEGLTAEEARERTPEAWERYCRVPLLWGPPGGESVTDLLTRVHRGLREVLDRHREGSVLLVAHGGPIQALLCLLLGLPLSLWGRFRLDHTGLTIVEGVPQGPVLSLLNDTSHLQGER